MTVKPNSGTGTLGAAACAVVLLFTGTGSSRTNDAASSPDSADALRAKYAAVRSELGNSAFDRPLVMTSDEGSDRVSVEIHALVNQPFTTASRTLNQPSRWCDILLLHLNTKYCRPSTLGGRTVLHVIIGRKYDQPIDEAYRVDFAYQVAASTPDYLQVKLTSDKGPLGTNDYRIDLEAVPAEGGRAFIRLSYSYAHGPVGRVAMRAYLRTIGRDKVGFTVVGRGPDGTPEYIGGMRGLVERNTMRYYLAIEAFLGALSAPPEARMEKSLRDWFAAVERYPRQLREMERSEYLDMKRKEYSRQQVAVIATSVFSLPALP